MRLVGIVLTALGLLIIINPKLLPLQVTGGTPYLTGVREPLVYRGYQMPGYPDNAVIALIYVAFTNPNPARYSLVSVHGKAYCGSTQIDREHVRGIPESCLNGGEVDLEFNLGEFNDPRTFRFVFTLVGIDETQEPPKTYQTFDWVEVTFTITPPLQRQTPSECIITFYTEPMLPPELTVQVSFVFNGIKYGVGQTARVPPGTYTISSVTPPSGYFVTGIYGTGGIFVDGTTVNVSGDGNIVAILSSKSNPGDIPDNSPPSGPSKWVAPTDMSRNLFVRIIGAVLCAAGLILTMGWIKR